jgi:tetratricopeptide (TPR) repeat protein
MEVEMSNYEFWDELGKIFEAVVAYQEKSVEFNKRFIHPWIKLGNVFDKQDRNSEAIRVYEKAIELEPGNAQNWYELGNIHFQMKNHTEAAQAYNKAIELAPDSGWSYSNLALTLATQGNYIEAIPLYQKGIDLLEGCKDRAVVWNRLGNAYRKLDQYELALQAFQNADELDEDNAGFRDDLDEIPDGPSLVEGVGSESSGSETEMIVEPVLLSLAENAVEEPAHVDAADESAPPESQAEIVEAMADALETVVEAQAQDTIPLDIQSDEGDVVAPLEEAEPISAEASPADGETLEIEPATDETAEVSIEVIGEEPVSGTVPAWVKQPAPVEITDSPEELSAMVVEAVSEIVETVEETAAIETNEPVAAIEEAVVVEEVVAEQVLETPADPTADPELVALVEEVAAVDPDQAFDEIVISEDALASAVGEPVAEETVSEEAAEITAGEPEVQAEAEPVLEETVALTETVEAVQEELSPETAHAAYDVFLKDNEEPQNLAVTEPETDAAPETAEPVAQVGPSGDVRIEMDAKNAHVWNELGNVYFGTGSYDDAIVAYTKAIELDRWFAWPYSNLALAYMQKGRFAEATLLYQRSIELFSNEKDKAISWNRLGNVYRRLNDYDNAIAAYQRADEMDPDNTTLSLQSRFSLLGSFSSDQKPSYAL